MSRTEPKKLDKTLIIFTGQSGIGKSTLCKYLVSDKNTLVSTDYVSCIIDSWYTLDGKNELVTVYNMFTNCNLHKLYEYINDNYPKNYAIELLDNYILKNNHDVILVEGALFDYKNFFTHFINACLERKIRVWVANRHI